MTRTRKRSRHTSDLGEREVGRRVALDNASRATSTASHNRRKPRLDSVGDAEIDGQLGPDVVPNLSGHNGNIDLDSRTTGTMPVSRTTGSIDIDGRTSGQLPASRLQGSINKANLPNDLRYGRMSSGSDVEWRDASVPKRAIQAVDWKNQVDNKPRIFNPDQAKAMEARIKKWANSKFKGK